MQENHWMHSLSRHKHLEVTRLDLRLTEVTGTIREKVEQPAAL